MSSSHDTTPTKRYKPKKKYVSRINCWGVRELLEQDSVDESLETERKYNEEIDEYLKAIRGK